MYVEVVKMEFFNTRTTTDPIEMTGIRFFVFAIIKKLLLTFIETKNITYTYLCPA